MIHRAFLNDNRDCWEIDSINRRNFKWDKELFMENLINCEISRESIADLLLAVCRQFSRSKVENILKTSLVSVRLLARRQFSFTFTSLISLYIATKVIHHRSAWDFLPLLLVYDPFLFIISMIFQLFNSLVVYDLSKITFMVFTWLLF